MAVELQPATAASEEKLRTEQWCRKQPCIVAGFVRSVQPAWARESALRITCTCGKANIQSQHFRAH
eukprot:7120981-Prymnesium_polylepis.1